MHPDQLQGAAATEDDAIAAIYRAAVGEQQWRDALDVVGKVIECWGIQLMEVNLVENRLGYSFEAGDAPAEGFVEYARKWHASDPHVEGLMSLPTGAWYFSEDHFDEAAVAVHPYYQEFLIPYGDRYVCGCKVHQDENSIVVLGLHRALGTTPLDGPSRARAARIGQHVSNALAIWRKQRQTLASAAIGVELLNRMGCPILLVDADGRIGVTNEQAAQMLRAQRDDTALQERDGVLVCSVRTANAQLKAALAQLNLADGGAGGQERAILRVQSPSGSLPPTLVCLLSLRPEATMGAFGRRAVAMVVVHDPSRQPLLDPFLVAAAYGLTPAEARVAVGVAAGLVPKTVAARHSVSPETVRSQLASLYRKLGINSSTQLAMLLNGAPAPFFTPEGRSSSQSELPP